MNLKNRTSCLFKIVLFIIFSIFVAEIIVLPKIEHDMLKEAGRQELVTVQQLCGAVLEKNPDVEQDFILLKKRLKYYPKYITKGISIKTMPGL